MQSVVHHREIETEQSSAPYADLSAYSFGPSKQIEQAPETQRAPESGMFDTLSLITKALASPVLRAIADMELLNVALPARQVPMGKVLREGSVLQSESTPEIAGRIGPSDDSVAELRQAA